MKKIIIIVVVIIFLSAVIVGFAYLFFKGGTSLVSGIDGNNRKSNYVKLTEDYAILKVEKTICLNTENGYERVTLNLDSLNWDDNLIVGHSRNKYFKIEVDTQQINYFGTRDSLMLMLSEFPGNTYEGIPGFKR